MNRKYEEARENLRKRSRRWLLTGAAGFIGSHLVEELLRLGQEVVAVDNFGTGRRENLAAVEAAVGESAWQKFRLHEVDVREANTMDKLCEGVEVVLHNAAISSVQFSLDHPSETFSNNAQGFVQVMHSAAKNKVARVVFASSAAVYGDQAAVPTGESSAPAPLSLYGHTKETNERTAHLFARAGADAVALRYFNVYGPRQDPASPYSGVIARFSDALGKGSPLKVYGDGETTRDFVHVADVVQANLLAALLPAGPGQCREFNVGTGRQTSLLQLLDSISAAKGKSYRERLAFLPFREKDIRHSCADISAIRAAAGYEPIMTLPRGLETMR